LEHKSTTKWLKRFWNEIHEPVDKLFLLQQRDRRNRQAEWNLIQVDLDETNEQKVQRIGEDHVRCSVRHFGDAKKRLVRNCRFWPLICEIKPSGDFGDIVVIRPNKVEETLAKRPYTRGWYQSTENLAEAGLVGPFIFSNLQGKTYRIADAIWKALEGCDEVRSKGVNISDMNQITLLL
jgi:hypothetical protein